MTTELTCHQSTCNQFNATVLYYLLSFHQSLFICTLFSSSSNVTNSVFIATEYNINKYLNNISGMASEYFAPPPYDKIKDKKVMPIKTPPYGTICDGSAIVTEGLKPLLYGMKKSDNGCGIKREETATEYAIRKGDYIFLDGEEVIPSHATTFGAVMDRSAGAKVCYQINKPMAKPSGIHISILQEIKII